MLVLERQTQYCTPAATTFENLVLPTGDEQQRAPGLRFGDPRASAVLAALCDFRWIHTGFHARDLRPLVAHHLAREYRMTQMAYDLRRLQRKGLITRIAGRHRYTLTALGRELALFCTKIYARVICPGLGQLHDARSHHPLSVAWRRFDREADALITNLHPAA